MQDTDMQETTKRKHIDMPKQSSTAQLPAAVPAMPHRATISVVIISCNEVDVLEPALQSVVSWVDEIVVVDMMSTDGTRELAQQYGARVIDHERLTYGDPARNFAFAQSRCDWILMLDPDERIPPLLARELRRLAEKDDIDVAVLQRRQIQFGTPMYSKGMADAPQTRFFRHGVIYWPPEVHGSPDISHLRTYIFPENAKDLYFLHDTWRTAQIALDKIVRYTPKDAAQRQALGIRYSTVKLFYHMLNEFLNRTINGRAYEDGVAGIITALYWSMYMFNVDAQLWELDGRPKAADIQVQRWGKRLSWIGRVLYRLLQMLRRLIPRRSRK